MKEIFICWFHLQRNGFDDDDGRIRNILWSRRGKWCICALLKQYKWGIRNGIERWFFLVCLNRMKPTSVKPIWIHLKSVYSGSVRVRWNCTRATPNQIWWYVRDAMHSHVQRTHRCLTSVFFCAQPVFFFVILSESKTFSSSSRHPKCSDNWWWWWFPHLFSTLPQPSSLLLLLPPTFFAELSILTDFVLQPQDN